MEPRLSELEPVAVVVNPAAAGQKWWRRKQARRLVEQFFGEKIYVASGSKEATVNLVAKIAPHHKTVIAVGGDGTIADVLEGLAKANCLPTVSLGIIPFGSGNAFRLSFAIPKNIEKALAVIQQGHTREVDLVRFEDKVAGFVSVGATAAVTAQKLEKPLRGFWGHVWAGRMLLKLQPQTWQIEVEDGLNEYGQPFSRLHKELKVLDVVIAKSNYFGYKWFIAPLARPEDGLLDVTFFEMSGPKYVLSLPSIFFGRKQRRLRHYKARRMVLRGRRMPVQYNGEFLGWRDEISFEVWPKALKLICPPAGQKT